MHDPLGLAPVRQGTIITAPATGLALALADAKAQLRIEPEDTWQDDYITLLCKSAGRKLESDLGYPVLRASLRTVLDSFPTSACGGAWRRGIWLGGGALPAVTGIEYLDSTGITCTLEVADWVLDDAGAPREVARILPSALRPAWPVALRQAGAVKVNWQAGWAAADDVPEDLQMAMRLLVGHWFENREAEVAGTITSRLQLGYEALIAPWRPNFMA